MWWNALVIIIFYFIYFIKPVSIECFVQENINTDCVLEKSLKSSTFIKDSLPTKKIGILH